MIVDNEVNVAPTITTTKPGRRYIIMNFLLLVSHSVCRAFKMNLSTLIECKFGNDRAAQSDDEKRNERENQQRKRQVTPKLSDKGRSLPFRLPQIPHIRDGVFHLPWRSPCGCQPVYPHSIMAIMRAHVLHGRGCRERRLAGLALPHSWIAQEKLLLGKGCWF